MDLTANARLGRATELIPVFLANYAKRFLEKGYDRAFQTKLGRKFLGLGDKKKYAIEFALYVLTAFFEKRLAGNTKLVKFAKEVGIDAAPEISKRMINGARAEISSSAGTSEEKELVDLFLSLGDEDLTEAVKWFCGKDFREKNELLSWIATLPSWQLARLLKLSAEEREKFFDVLNPKSRPEEAGQGVLGLMADDVRKLRGKSRIKEEEQ